MLFLPRHHLVSKVKQTKGSSEHDGDLLDREPFLHDLHWNLTFSLSWVYVETKDYGGLL